MRIYDVNLLKTNYKTGDFFGLFALRLSRTTEIFEGALGLSLYLLHFGTARHATKNVMRNPWSRVGPRNFE
jgi:hypothetical protein